jgi:hypothetical protein
MKKYRFLWLPLLTFAAFTLSCQRDTEQSDPKPLSDSPVIFRACSGPCPCTVTTDVDATLDLCGDLPDSVTSCNTGCAGGDTGGAGAEFVANEPKEFCVDPSGNLCIKNVGSSSVEVTVRFGSSTAIVITIGVNETQCFHTNSGCTLTGSHCQ